MKLKNSSFAKGSHGYSTAMLAKMKLFYEEQLTPVSQKTDYKLAGKSKRIRKRFL